MTAVRCVDLCKTYRQGDQDIKALDHVSIEINQVSGCQCQDSLLHLPAGVGLIKVCTQDAESDVGSMRPGPTS